MKERWQIEFRVFSEVRFRSVMFYVSNPNKHWVVESYFKEGTCVKSIYLRIITTISTFLDGLCNDWPGEFKCSKTLKANNYIIPWGRSCVKGTILVRMGKIANIILKKLVKGMLNGWLIEWTLLFKKKHKQKRHM